MSKRTRREERNDQKPSGWVMPNWKVDPIGVVIVVIAVACIVGMIIYS